MTTILSWWPWLAGGGLVGVVLAVVFNPASSLLLVRELGALALDLLRGLVRWLRGRRDWGRILAALAGAGCLVLGLTLAQVKRDAAIAAAQCDAKLSELGGQLTLATSQHQATASAAQVCQAALEREVGRSQAVDAMATAATAAARTTAAQAAKDREAWQKTYDDRPADCRQAQLQLEAKCPALRDY